MRHIVFVVIGLSMIACGGLKPGASKDAKSLYENYFVGEGGSMYFIKPLEFRSDDKFDATADFTFTNADLSTDTAVVNLDYIIPLKSAPSLISLISESGDKTELKVVQQLYIERFGEGFKYRYSCSGSLQGIKGLFEAGQFRINVETADGNTYSFHPKKKSIKAIQNLRYGLFELLD